MGSEQLPSTDEYYMGITLAVREKANCTGSRVAAVIVKGNRVVSTGYNGTPSGMTNCLDGGCLRCQNPNNQFESGEGYDLCICVHAEQNALLAAARFGISVEGATIYTSMQPCFGCAKELLQAQVKTVVYLHPWIPSDPDPVMDELKKAEYDKLAEQLNMSQLDFPDPKADWAVSKRRQQNKCCDHN